MASPTNQIATTSTEASVLEKVLLGGDLSSLNPTELLHYYKAVCESVGLNPLTKPFDVLELDGKKVLYARRDCGDQLRKIHDVNIKVLHRGVTDGVYTVTVQAKLPNGREDEAIGAIPIEKEGGVWEPYEWMDYKTKPATKVTKKRFVPNGTSTPLPASERALVLMKCETKAKRRVTLSICGLGIMDESEIEDIPAAEWSSTRELAETTADQLAEADPGLKVEIRPKQTPTVIEVLELSQEEQRNERFIAEQKAKQEADAKAAANQPKPEAAQPEPEKPKEQSASEKLKADILAKVEGATQKDHLVPFYRGYFGPGKLPNSIPAYVEPLQLLWDQIEMLKELLLSAPLECGKKVKEARDEAAAAETKTAEPETEALATGTIDHPLTQEFPKWNKDTLLIAQAAMAKANGPVGRHVAALHTFGISQMEDENARMALLLYSHNAPDALKLLTTGQPPSWALGLAEKHLGGKLTMTNQTPASKSAVTKALAEVTA